MITMREATVADAIAVSPRLRQADVQEWKAAVGLSPEVALRIGLSSGEAWAMLVDGQVEALLGVSAVANHSYFGLVWMVATDAIFDHRRDLLRMTPEVLTMLHDRFPLLGNYVDARNSKHIAWLKRAGFSLLREVPDYGVEQRPFFEFAKLRAEPCAK